LPHFNPSILTNTQSDLVESVGNDPKAQMMEENSIYQKDASTLVMISPNLQPKVKIIDAQLDSIRIDRKLLIKLGEVHPSESTHFFSPNL
jgi:hypothetical protein